MRLHTITHDTTLYELAREVGRDPAHLAYVNALPHRARLSAGDILLIPAPRKGSGHPASALLLACDVEAGYTGSAPFIGKDASLLFCRGGHLTRDGVLTALPRRHIRPCDTPSLLTPDHIDAAIPSPRIAEQLHARGYAGVCLPYRLQGELYRPTADALHAEDLLFTLTADGSAVINHPTMLDCPYDLLTLLPPRDTPLEIFLSDLTLITDDMTRRKILISLLPEDGLTDQRKNGARNGRRHQTNGRGLQDCYMGLSRLLYNGYGGVCVTWGRLSPPLYHMLCEMGTVIPASQRTGKRSPS